VRPLPARQFTTATCDGDADSQPSIVLQIIQHLRARGREERWEDRGAPAASGARARQPAARRGAAHAQRHGRRKVVREAALEHAVAKQRVVVRPLGEVKDHVILAVPRVEEARDVGNGVAVKPLDAWRNDDAESGEEQRAARARVAARRALDSRSPTRTTPTHPCRGRPWQ
jgi:hypothetical protein